MNTYHIHDKINKEDKVEIMFSDKFGKTTFSITRQELFSLLKNNVINSDTKRTAYL